MGEFGRGASRLLWGTPLGVVLVADVLVVVPSPTLLRYVSAVLLVCVLPGGALLSLGAIRRRGLPPWELALWVVALSLAAVTLLGLVLDLLPWGLTKAAWLAALNVCGLPGLVLFALRARPGVLSRPAVDRRLAVRACGLVVAAAFVAAAVVVRVRNADTAVRSQPFVALWAIPGPTGVVLGVRSETPTSTAYRLVFSRHPGRITVFRFTLEYAEEWRRHLIIRRSGTSPGVVAEASLFRGGRSTAIRSVRVRVGPPKKRRSS